MIQLSLFQFPDEAPRSSASDQTRSERWDHWWLTMLRWRSSFPDEEEELHDRDGASHLTPRQTTFLGFP